MFITEGGYADYQAELNKRKPAGHGLSAQAYEFNAERDSALPKLPASEASPNGKMRNKAEQTSGQEHDHSASSAANPATLRKMEQEISSLEQRIAQIDEAMLDPGIGSDADKLNVLLEERVEIQRNLDPLIDKYISLLEK